MKNGTNGLSNILFILTDQHRLFALGAYGSTPCLTPNLDRLAENWCYFQECIYHLSGVQPGPGFHHNGKIPA